MAVRGVEFRVLGPVEASVGGRRVALAGPRQERVLTTLLLEADRAVSIDRLVDAVWDVDPPATARRQVQDLVGRMRRAFVDAGVSSPTIITNGAGYTLRLDGHRLDAREFDDLVGRARAVAATDPATAVVLLRQALGLWRGPVSPRCDESATARWEDRRLAAAEECLGLEIGLGRVAEATTELTGLAIAHPYREGMVGLLMIGLSRAGRRAEALEAYDNLRKRLVTELGVEPGPEVRQIQRAVLRGEATATVSGDGGPVVRPAQLPPVLRGFVGRTAELDGLDAALGSTGILALSGPAGVGKTTLAVYWAHRVRDRFPDGQLYVDLRGFTPAGSPVAPDEAVRGFLDALGVSPRRIPPGAQAQIGMYRSLLADRRVLLVLDNARDATQVRPLLPGAAGCVAVVTSRTDLPGLVATDNALPIRIGLPPAEDARALIAGRLGPARLGAEPAASDRVIDRCGRLPLALAIVAARAAADPDLTLAAVADELTDVGTRLDALAGADPATDIRTVFSWSYRVLDPIAAGLFRRLSVHPGPDFGVWTAAAAADVAPATAARALRELARAHLLTAPASGRYGMHDLVRAYGAELVVNVDGPAETAAARQRVLVYYATTARAAAALLRPSRQGAAEPLDLGAAAEPLADAAAARAWFAREHAGLLAAVQPAGSVTAHDDAARARLAWSLVDYLDWQGHWADQIVVQRAAVDAATRLPDPAELARAHAGLARAHVRLDAHDEAAEHFHRALALYAADGDRVGRADVHRGLGGIAARRGEHDEALRQSQRSLSLYRAAGHRPGAAVALNNLAWTHGQLGDHERAAAAGQRAVELLRELGDRFGEADGWDTVGYAYHRLGRLDDAIACYVRAVDLFNELGDRANEADSLDHLGDVYRDAGQDSAAADAFARAVLILGDLGRADLGRVRAKLEQLSPA